MGSVRCFRCGQVRDLAAGESVTRSDLCRKCMGDLKVCKNCRHYDVTARWECREAVDERVSDKEKANFCGWFQPAESVGPGAPVAASTARDDLMKAAEALFKKK